LHTDFKEKYKEETVNTKFLGLQIDTFVNWKNHIEQMLHTWGQPTLFSKRHIACWHKNFQQLTI
jgi:hypothetical protein